MNLVEMIEREKILANDISIWDQKYHEQLVKYLEELKSIKDNRVFVSNEPIEEIFLRGYKRGLEDAKVEQSVGNDLDKFREQLKEFHKVDVIVR